MLSQILITIALSTFVVGSPKPGISTSIVPLSSLSKLNVDKVVKTVALPQGLNGSAITHPSVVPDDKPGLTPEIIEGFCLDPSDRPVSADCEAICENLALQQGPLLIPPFDVWMVETGHCVFGFANLDPCIDIYLDPISEVAPSCTSMYSDCVVDGYDGFLQDTDFPGWAMALSGTAAAPPYAEGPCATSR